MVLHPSRLAPMHSFVYPCCFCQYLVSSAAIQAATNAETILPTTQRMKGWTEEEAFGDQGITSSGFLVGSGTWLEAEMTIPPTLNPEATANTVVWKLRSRSFSRSSCCSLRLAWSISTIPR